MLRCLCKKRTTHAKKKDQLRDKILEDKVLEKQKEVEQFNQKSKAISIQRPR